MLPRLEVFEDAIESTQVSLEAVESMNDWLTVVSPGSRITPRYLTATLTYAALPLEVA